MSERPAQDPRLPVFTGGLVQTVILTTPVGAKRLLTHNVPHSVRILALPSDSGEIPAAAMLKPLARLNAGRRILVEGGPPLVATFYKSRCLDEQFLSLAPQIAGRESGDGRLGLVMGKTFAQRDPLGGKLVDARQGNRLLFLRYEFPRSRAPGV